MRKAIAVAALLAGLAAGQTPPPANVFVQRSITGPPPPPGAFGMISGPVAFEYIASEFGSEGGLVKGAPYSAQATTETVQTLADGNRIVRKNVSEIYRDSEGRTRREQTLDMVGPLATEQPHKMIFINDPIAGVNYVLDPQRKTAEKIAVHHENGVQTMRGTIGVQGHMVGGATTTVTSALPDLPPPPPGPRAEAVIVRRFSTAANSSDTNQPVTTPLGSQSIESVLADGTKTVMTIPAGQIGNERPIDIVSERWYSQDLQTVMLSKRSDPRIGETTFSLKSVSRDEPAHSLFEVPSDYTVNEGMGGNVMWKSDGTFDAPVKLKLKDKE
jgi:hypothetical protein